LIPHEKYDLVEKCFADNTSFLAKRKESEQKKKTLMKVYDICHAGDTTDMMSAINDSEMAFTSASKNVLSTTWDNSRDNSIYSGETTVDGWTTSIPENFEFSTLPSRRKKDH
jgi:hypothetical protein